MIKERKSRGSGRDQRDVPDGHGPILEKASSLKVKKAEWSDQDEEETEVDPGHLGGGQGEGAEGEAPRH